MREIRPVSDVDILRGMGAKIRHIRYDLEEKEKKYYKKDNPSYDHFVDGFLVEVTYEIE